MDRKRDKRIQYDLVIIEWIDASRLSESWIDMSDIPEVYPHKCVTVGFVVSSNKRGKILVPTIADIEHSENSHAYGGMMIPAKSIISERRLR